jgi:hypothetical protein
MATHWAIKEPGGTYCCGKTGGWAFFGADEKDALRWGTKKNAQAMIDADPSAFDNCVVVKLTAARGEGVW